MKPKGIIPKIIDSILICFSLLFLMYSVNGQSYSNAFLNTNFGARQLGMGNASISNTFDLNAGFYNPAGLSRINVPLQFGMMHHRWLDNQVTQNAFSLSARISSKNKRALAFNILQSTANNIPNSRLLVGPEGNIDIDRISAFNSVDQAGMIAFGQNIGKSEKWSWGSNVKMIYRNPGSSAKAWGVGIDAGLLYVQDKFSFALHVVDMITINRWYFSLSEEEKRLIVLSGNPIPLKKTEIVLPRTILGGSYYYNSPKINAIISGELELSSVTNQQNYFKTDAIQFLPRFGVEFQFLRIISMRTGIISIDRKINPLNPTSKTIIVSPAAGFGIQIKRLKIDYGFTTSRYQNPNLQTHLLGVKLDFKPKT